MCRAGVTDLVEDNDVSVQGGQAKLHYASKKLTGRWDGTKFVWRDEVSRRFEENHLMPLISKLQAAEGAMGRMEAILQQVRRDCG